MAYPFRSGNPQTGGEALDDSRSPNKNQTQASNNDNRGGLTRRFTMNALPTLSPIGQQRRQAAGDLSGMVSTQYFPSVGMGWVGLGGRSSGFGSSSTHNMT